MFLEMSRDETHGGGAWAFKKCVWAPTRKKENGSRWPFWTKILDIRAGDAILHLRGTPPDAAFVGYSIAVNDGFETLEHPPDPGDWAYSNTFYRADLEDFVAFHASINLSDIFSARQAVLEHYFESNKSRSSGKKNIFYVRQSGRLQCQNGAYLSDVDEELFAALFDVPVNTNNEKGSKSPITVETSSQLATVERRLGQSAFSKSIKDLYGHSCCIPSCPVADSRFLVGSHIARWIDNKLLRGHPGNGLCLCLMHDKAFERGVFTIDKEFRIFVNPNESKNSAPFVEDLRTQHGKRIALGSIAPLEDAIMQHWARVKLIPHGS